MAEPADEGHIGSTTEVLPDFSAILSMHRREHALWMPSTSLRSYQPGGLNQRPPLPQLPGSRFPHPSQIHSTAIFSLQPAGWSPPNPPALD